MVSHAGHDKIANCELLNLKSIRKFGCGIRDFVELRRWTQRIDGQTLDRLWQLEGFMQQRQISTITLFIMLTMILAACISPTSPPASDSTTTDMADSDTTMDVEATEMPMEEEPDEEATGEEDEESESEEAAIEPLFAGFDPANFTNSTTIDNEWSPFVPGMHWAYEGETVEDGESIPHRIEFTVTDLTKEINGVQTVVAWVVDISEDEVVESELSFYAQDDDGAVWYFGEYPEEYEEGELVDAPTWIAGLEEAQPGVKMVKEPQTTTPIYFQGWAPAVEWSDFGVVRDLVDEVCVPVDCYPEVLVIDESSLEEVGAFQQKFYARGIGNIHVEWTGEDASKETLDMIEFSQLDADAMAEVNALALEQEARAYEQSPDVYGLTAPIAQ